jgi:Flp pilus assembly protein TadB
VLSDDPATVQFPRVAPATDPASWSGRPPGGGEPPAGLGNATRAIPTQKANGRRLDERPRKAWKATEEAHGADPGRDKSTSDKLHSDESPSQEPHGDEVHGDEVHGDESEYGSPVREWAVMVAQIGIGIVGGAALWLICEWLWQRMPVVALIVALAVITGLVWVVRRVRRADDLQTTVIAVLVGLFVTVSPAALLLVGGR